MKPTRDIFADMRMREEREKVKLQRLGTEGYLTIRKAQMIEQEIRKPKKK